MQIAAKKLFSFMRYKKIKVYEEHELTFFKWNHQVEKKEVTHIYYDSEDMWIDREPQNIVGIDWEHSEFNVNDELLKKVYGLNSGELATIGAQEKKLMHDEIDFDDKMEWRNEILIKELEKYVRY